jgi:hypothetical protein
MPTYSVFPDHLVDPRARNLEKLTRSDVCEILKIKPPARRWIVEDEFGSEWFAENINGYCQKNGLAIYIRHDCSPFEIASTTVHEARHAWQIRNPRRFPIPSKTYSRDMNQTQRERDARIFELEFWAGREKRDGSFNEIEHLLTAMKIERAQARVQAASQQYDFKQRVGLSYASSGYYPSQVKMRLIVPSEQEMEESLLDYILHGDLI